MKFKRLLVTILFTILALTSTFSFASDNELSLYSEAAVLMDSNTGTILYEKNGKERMYPASTTKIMTAILAIENCDLNDIATVSYDAVMSVPSGYSNAALQIGEELTVGQLLEVLLVHSANDAANVLAEHVGGSVESFATMMNTKANELGCTGTHFTNPSGKHDDNHYTTAYDLALITQYCMKNSTFRSIVSKSSCTIAATNKYEQRHFNNTNELVIPNNTKRADNYYYQYAIGVKTGYTKEAKNCLISASNKDDFELISVVLGAGPTEIGLSGRNIDSINLLNYGYDNYTIKKLKDKGDIIKQVQVDNATKDTKNLDLVLSESITALMKANDSSNSALPEIKIDNLEAPIAKDSVVGSITYNVNGIEYTGDLLAANDVEKSKFGPILIRLIFLILILFIIYKLASLNTKKAKRNRKKFSRFN